jgi:formiminotetrahydrofolate cyclodeaminase
MRATLSNKKAYVVPKSRKEMNEVREKKGENKGKRAGYVPMPMTVPYSDFLSCAETTGGQRRMTARKRKKAKESP